MQALEGGWVSGDNGRMRAQDLVQVMAEHGVGLTPFVNPVVPLALTIRPILQACRAGSAQSSGVASVPAQGDQAVASGGSQFSIDHRRERHRAVRPEQPVTRQIVHLSAKGIRVLNSQADSHGDFAECAARDQQPHSPSVHL